MQALASGAMASFKTYYEQDLDTWLINSADRVVTMCVLKLLQCGEADCLILELVYILIEK